MVEKNERPRRKKADERYKLTDSVSAGMSIRERYEVKDDFRFDNTDPKNDDNYLLSQIRLNLQWKPAETVTVFVEGQDARAAGEETFSDSSTPNIYADDFDLHQGYVDIQSSAEAPEASARVGRQKLLYGQQRLVGPLEWVNTARVFDAAKVTVGDIKGRSVDLFSSRAVGVDPGGPNDWDKSGSRYANSDFHGVYFTDKTMIEKGVIEAYYLFRHEDTASDRVSTLGTRVVVPTCEQLTVDGEFAWQFGDFGGMTHRAFAVHAGLTMLVDEDTATSVNGQYNFASGDGDSTDSTHETFDNLYPTNHALYGYMDFFSWQNLHNIELSANRDIVSGLTLRVAWNGFWLAEADSDSWYNAGLGAVRSAGGTDVSSFVGHELDITLKYPFLEKRLWAELGYSHFFTGSYISDTGSSNDADFFYSQLKFAI